MDIVYEAYCDAFVLHGKQIRKNTNVPYMIHILSVCEQLSFWGIEREKYPEIWTATMLHDSIEDSDNTQSSIAEKYGDKIANWVALLSFRSKKDEENGREYQREKTNYLNSFIEKPVEVLIIKLADRFCNILDFQQSSSEYASIYANYAAGLINCIISRKQNIFETFGTLTYSKIHLDFFKS